MSHMVNHICHMEDTCLEHQFSSEMWIGTFDDLFGKNQISRHPTESGAPSRYYEMVFGPGCLCSVS